MSSVPLQRRWRISHGLHLPRGPAPILLCWLLKQWQRLQTLHFICVSAGREGRTSKLYFFKGFSFLAVLTITSARASLCWVGGHTGLGAAGLSEGQQVCRQGGTREEIKSHLHLSWADTKQAHLPDAEARSCTTSWNQMLSRPSRLHMMWFPSK